MKKKIFYAILICIIIAGIAVIATIGLKVDIDYSKNIRIDVYLGKTYNQNEVVELSKEVFGTDRVAVQQVEYYGDMYSLTISQDIEDLDKKIEEYNNKLNEKYQIENKKEDIKVTYQPKVKLFDVVKPYLIPLAISMSIILVYAMVRFRKIGILKTLAAYILYVLAVEGVYLSIIAIARIPIGRLIIPIGLAILVITMILITAKREKKLMEYHEEENKKKK